MNEDAAKLWNAIIAAYLMAIVLAVVGLIMGINDDFRAFYLYAQAVGLGVMVILGIRSGQIRFGFEVIVAALAVCMAINFWLGYHGPVYLSQFEG